MLVKDIIDALGELVISTSGNSEQVIQGASDDSRQIQEGWAFCAISGDLFDGHGFIGSAIKKGAVAVVAEHPVDDLPDDFPLVVVSNGYRAAGIVANTVIGGSQSITMLTVTGTNGKTTSAYLLRAILKAAGHPTAMIGTVEYDLADGHPITADRTTPTAFNLQKLLKTASDNDATDCIMEVSSHALALQRLGNMTVNGAIFTNLTQDHLDYHKTVENYYQAKKLLFTRHIAPHGIAVINADNAYGKRLAQELNQERPDIQTVTFGVTPDADAQIADLNMNAESSSFILKLNDGTTLPVKTPLVGEYNAANVCGVVLLARAIQIPNEVITSAIAACHSAPGRLQRVPNNKGLGIFIDYAHTPDALVKVLAALRPITTGRLVAVFGCGGDRDKTKRPIMGEAVKKAADHFIVTSDNPRTENPCDIISDIVAGIDDMSNGAIVVDRYQAIKLALQQATPGDVILIAGKGHEDYQEINGVKHPFSDLGTVQELLGIHR